MKISACFFPVILTVAGLAALTSCDKPTAAPAPAPLPVRELPGPAKTPGTPLPETSPLPAETAEAPVPASGLPSSPALESFKQEMANLKIFMDDQSQQPDAASGMAALKQLIARARAVKTDGLPEDLKDAYDGVAIVMGKLGAELETLPFPADKMEEYLGQLPASESAALQPKIEKFKRNMETIDQEGRISSANLRAVAKKYGIEGIDLGN